MALFLEPNQFKDGQAEWAPTCMMEFLYLGPCLHWMGNWHCPVCTVQPQFCRQHFCAAIELISWQLILFCQGNTQWKVDFFFLCSRCCIQGKLMKVIVSAVCFGCIWSPQWVSEGRHWGVDLQEGEREREVEGGRFYVWIYGTHLGKCLHMSLVLLYCKIILLSHWFSLYPTPSRCLLVWSQRSAVDISIRENWSIFIDKNFFIVASFPEQRPK